jgi:hypothetical protein
MTHYDFCLAWNWEHDAHFTALIAASCLSHGLSLLQITPHNLEDVLTALIDHQVTFWAFMDRASDVDPRFAPVVQWARHNAAYCINPDEQARRVCDKATMHPILIGAGLDTPYTIILPAYAEQPDLPPVDLSPLSQPFTIKPACGGGGSGVVTDAYAWSQVLQARQQFPQDRYLLQAHVVPARLESRAAWFRIIYCAGRVYPCWWDTNSHVYTRVVPDEEDAFGLGALRRITDRLAYLSQLDLFSTEICLTSDGLFVVVDYVNDQIDLRLQSQAADGVPDDIVRDVAERLLGLVTAHHPLRQ